MFTPKLIASDLDGTLLQDHVRRIDEQTLKLIENCLDAGISFAAASGRQYQNLRHLFAPVADRIDYVCENGCLVFAGNKLIHRDTMPRELGNAIIDAILATPHANVMISSIDSSYLLAGNDAFYHHVRDYVGNQVTLTTDIHDMPEPYFKISLFDDCYTDGCPSIDSQPFREQFGKDCHVVYGGNGWIDFMPKNTNKATALAHLGKYLAIGPQDIMAFGDEENDKEMMQYAGFPVAMAQGNPEIQQMAKLTTGTVSEILKKVLDACDLNSL